MRVAQGEVPLADITVLPERVVVVGSGAAAAVQDGVVVAVRPYAAARQAPVAVALRMGKQDGEAGSGVIHGAFLVEGIVVARPLKILLVDIVLAAAADMAAVAVGQYSGAVILIAAAAVVVAVSGQAQSRPISSLIKTVSA